MSSYTDFADLESASDDGAHRKEVTIGILLNYASGLYRFLQRRIATQIVRLATELQSGAGFLNPAELSLLHTARTVPVTRGSVLAAGISIPAF